MEPFHSRRRGEKKSGRLLAIGHWPSRSLLPSQVFINNLVHVSRTKRRGPSGSCLCSIGSLISPNLQGPFTFCWVVGGSVRLFYFTACKAGVFPCAAHRPWGMPGIPTSQQPQMTQGACGAATGCTFLLGNRGESGAAHLHKVGALWRCCSLVLKVVLVDHGSPRHPGESLLGITTSIVFQ